jgi:hypothetical protein
MPQFRSVNSKMHLRTVSPGKYVDVGGVDTGNKGTLSNEDIMLGCMYSLDIGNRQMTRVLLENLKIFEDLEEGDGKGE